MDFLSDVTYRVNGFDMFSHAVIQKLKSLDILNMLSKCTY